MYELKDIRESAKNLPEGIMRFRKYDGSSENKYLINLSEPSEIQSIMKAIKHIDEATSEKEILVYPSSNSNNAMLAELIYEDVKDQEEKKEIICISPISPDGFVRVNVPEEAKNVSWLVNQIGKDKGAIIFYYRLINYRINLDPK